MSLLKETMLCFVLEYENELIQPKRQLKNVLFLSKIRMFGNDLVRFGPVRFGKKKSGSVRFGGSVKILVRSNTIRTSRFVRSLS